MNTVPGMFPMKSLPPGHTVYHQWKKQNTRKKVLMGKDPKDAVIPVLKNPSSMDFFVALANK
jgi:hypothetical protein